MQTPPKRRGLFSRNVTRLLHAPLLILVLAAALLLPQVASAAPSFSGINSSDSAKEFFRVDGHDLPSTQYQALPQKIDGKDSVDPKQLKIAICATTGSNGSGQCTQTSSDAHLFAFSRMQHDDLGGGVDIWDYTFVASGNNQLRFLYRKNPDGKSFWGLVYGDTDKDAEFTKNFVAGLSGLGDTDLARNILENEADDEGLAWAKKGGIATSTTQSDFLDRSDGSNDPFMKAVEKATEALNSINKAISSALLWAIETSNPNEVHGLAEAWRTIRDLVNILFMVILIALALITIVRLDTRRYNVRSLLPLLVFAVITVNFSFLFASILVNTSYVLSQPFLSSAREIIEHAGLLGSTAPPDITDFGTAFVMLLATLIMLIALAVLLFFFIIRIIMIWLLTAASPIIFLAMVLPLTRGEASKLLTQWVRWVYMAPIAFIVLYIGSRVAMPNPGQDEATDALLSAIFYGGLVMAAALIPIALGGGLMRSAASRGAGAGKLAGKAGLGLTGSIPLGRGMTVGEAARTGKALVKARSTAQEDRANERAITMASAGYDRLGPGLGGAVFGLDDSRSQQYRLALVEKEQKEQMLNGLGADGAYKVVQHQTGQMAASELSHEELAVARSPIGELAAWKTVVDNNFAETDHLARYARHGLHRQSKDALISAVQKSYRGGGLAPHIEPSTLQYGLSFADAEGYKDMPGSFWARGLDPAFQAAQPQAAQMLRDNMQQHINPSGIQKFFDNTDRARGPLVKRERAGQAYDLMNENVRRVMRTSNYKSWRDGNQHVGMGGRTKAELAAYYESLTKDQVRNGDPGHP
jgi:hypothetical protein